MDKRDPKQRELDELMEQVDRLLSGEESWLEEPAYGEASDAGCGEETFDPEDYTPAGLREEEPVFYRNYSNQYGAQVRNYQNGYGSGAAPRDEVREVTIPAYNADFRTPRREERPRRERQPGNDVRPVQPEYTDPGEEPVKKKKKRRKCGCLGLLTVPAALVLALVLAASLLLQMPKGGDVADRKSGTATILLCGTDADGTRTDTMMLLYLSGPERKVGLLSLPRDTYTLATAGYAAKLNSAYGRNNCGREGMEALLDYVEDIIGYRPDGYVLVNMAAVPQIVDALGGLEYDVPLRFKEGKVTLQAGQQRLDGKQVLALLRHRSSYATADLKRIEVQRSVLKACMEQWISAEHLGDIGTVLALLEEHTLSSLNTRNYLWIAKTVLLNLRKGFLTETLPGEAAYLSGGSYYLLDRTGVARLINESFNPSRRQIDPAALNIAGE